MKSTHHNQFIFGQLLPNMFRRYKAEILPIRRKTLHNRSEYVKHTYVVMIAKLFSNEI